ncbi:acyltransferase family protein [Sneathiella glossodoripedis]|uniref:acyltransferase family protein n=1 Tax=Sneathiella glossodoripedis TaxID=418853 RepID=UPI0004723F87|nr:acyltransferase [Sneathiella glossodoripedis]
MLLCEFSNTRDNNFNLIRILAAWLVLFSHSYAIVFGGGEFEPLRWLGVTWGGIAVDVFFVTSGFLITQSLTRSSLLSFALKRALRIFPALIVAVCLMVVLLSDDLFSFETLKFFVKNTTLFLGVSYTLPGAFIDTPLGPAVNGSLWTLPWEVRCYAAVILVTAFRPKLMTPVVAIGLMLFAHQSEAARICGFFFVGASIFHFRDKIVITHWLAAGFLVALLVSLSDPNIFRFVYPFALPYFVFYLAYVPEGSIRKFNKFGDYSYGMYIYAFPIQQALTHVTQDVYLHIILATVMTFVPAFLSWHLIEKHAINPDFRARLVLPLKAIRKGG